MWRAAIRLHGLMSHSGDHIGIFGAWDGTLWIMLTFCRQCCRRSRSQRTSPATSQDVRPSPPLAPSFLGFCRLVLAQSPSDWWQKLNYDSKWTAAGGQDEMAGNAGPLATWLIIKYMNFLDNNRCSLAGIIMGARWPRNNKGPPLLALPFAL